MRPSWIPTLSPVFKTNTNKDSSPAGDSANGAGPSMPAPALPRHLEQKGTKNFARFSNFFNKSTIRPSQTAEPSATTSGTSEDILNTGRQRRLELAEKMVQEKAANIDLCTKIDWAGFASRDPALAPHVSELQQQVETANQQLKADIIEIIRSMPDSISQALDKNKPDIEQEAKKETRKRIVEKLATGVLLARPLRTARLATRNELVQRKLDALEQDLTGKFQQSMASKEAAHSVAFRDPCVMFFRKKFGGNGPELLEQMVNELGMHAKKAMSGELTGSGIAENHRQRDIPRSPSVFSEDSGIGLSDTPIYDRFIRRESVNSQNADEELSHNTPEQETEKLMKFLGDGLDPNIKRFLENKELPDAKRNDKGELEWTSKTQAPKA